MTHLLRILLLLVLTSALVGCQTRRGRSGPSADDDDSANPGDDDDATGDDDDAADDDDDAVDDDDNVDLPDEIPLSWFGDLSGTWVETRVFLSGALEGSECAATGEFAGTQPSDLPASECAACDLTWQVEATEADVGCPGDSFATTDVSFGLALDQEDESAVLWLGYEALWNQWTELGEGSLQRTDAALLVHHEQTIEPAFGQQVVTEEPCDAFAACRYEVELRWDVILEIEPD